MVISEIWKHFDPLKLEGKAKCKHCSKKLSHKDSSTKGLWDHLRQVHNITREDASKNTEQLPKIKVLQNLKSFPYF